MKINAVLHIGMPKCMSTSIQAYLLGAKSVFFMGIGPSRHVDDEVLHAFQRQIVSTPTHFYDHKSVARIFDRCLTSAIDAGDRLLALSDETIPFPLGYGRRDTSYTERLQRLRAVMPDNTQVLMITRRPEDYLKSTYKHRTVMNGMTFTFDEYLRRMLLLGDTYLLATTKFFHYAEEARRIFGNVRVIPMEDLEDDPAAMLSFFEGLGAQGGQVTPRENPGMADDKFENFRNLHAAYGDTLADDDFNVMAPAERNICKANEPYFDSILAQMLAKERVLATLRDMAVSLQPKTAGNLFEISDETRTRLKEYVAQSNAGLKAHYGVDIDTYSYDEF